MKSMFGSPRIASNAIVALSVLVAIVIIGLPIENVEAVPIKEYTGCRDSDGGQVISTRGDVQITYGSGSASPFFRDYCFDKFYWDVLGYRSTLREYYCETPASLEAKYVDVRTEDVNNLAICRDGAITVTKSPGDIF